MTTTTEYLHLQARCRKILNDLHVPRPYSREGLIHWLEELRGRPLFLRELPWQAAGAGMCGLWDGTDAADYVFYERRTAPVHQEHIILHEIGHMLSGHHHAPVNGSGIGFDGDLRDLLDGLQPRLIKRLMARTSYTSAQEREAEMLASLLHSSADLRRTSGAVGRLGAVLGVRVADEHH
ncbi:regulator component [Streptomyces sp. 4N509B]|uniref:regulator component n=1 Tax=Streptomyces sp. 4N509B TaxID=3457413 RepID=UPI003FD1167C